MKSNTRASRPDLDPIVAACAAINTPPIVEIQATLSKGNPLIAALKRAGMHVILIDRAPVYSKETLLHALYQNTPFPGYFGFNWDALQDVLADFSWLADTPKGIVLVLRDAARFKADSAEDWASFTDIVETVSGIWAKKRSLPFHLLIGQ